MREPYEDLVSEYLELQDYFVRQGFKYGKNKRKELDILAVKLEPREVIVAEVTSRWGYGTISELVMKLRSRELDNEVKQRTGLCPTKRVLYYWLPSARNVEEEKTQKKRIERVAQMAKPDIHPKPLQGIAKELHKSAWKNRSSFYYPRQPVSTLLQLLLPEKNT